MSKEAEARVRDELLQKLYSNVLRCTLALAGAGVRGAEFAAMAAGMAANLLPSDMLLLPARGGAGFRVMRDLAPVTVLGHAPRERAAGVITLPTNEPQAVAMTLGAAATAAHVGQGALVCAVLPAAAVLDEWAPEAKGVGTKGSALPVTWAGAGVYAARLGLPLLLVTNRPARERLDADSLQASTYPAIPVDREDALAMYRVAYECASRTRLGFGPSLIRCVPFVPAGSGGGSDAALARLESMLRQRGAFNKAWHRRLERQILREIAG